MVNKVQKAFRLAKQERLRSDHTTYKLGSCIMQKNKVVSVGYNSAHKAHPLIRKFDPFKTIHAELRAILKCKNRNKLIGADIYVYREDKAGRPTLARPCTVCLQILKIYGIKGVYYTTSSGYLYLEL